MSGAAQELLDRVTAAFWSVLERYRSAAAGALAGLPPEPGFGGTVLDGRLLQAIRPDAIAAGDPAVRTLVSAIGALVPEPAPNLPVALHGFDPGGGQPRGVALVFTTPAPTRTVVVALTGAGPTGLAVEVAGVGAGAIAPVRLPLIGSWSVQLAGDVAGGGRLQFARGGPPQVLDAAAPVHVRCTVERDGLVESTVVGLENGPHLRLSTVAVDVTTRADAGTPTVSFDVAMPDARLSLVDEMVAAFMGSAMDLRVDLGFSATPEHGLTFSGGGVQTSVPVNLDAPGVELHAIQAGLAVDGSDLSLSFGLGFTAGLPGIPISFAVDGLGAAFPIAIGGTDLGVDPGAVRPTAPRGLGVDLNLPIVSGGGFLAVTGPGAYGGVLAVSLIEISVQAFGLLQLPVGDQPLAFVAIIAFQFPPPGIQLGFGFSLNAVGGIVAINRRVDVPALQQAVIDGSADQLLFPVNPASHAPAIVATMGRVFPVAPGHLVIGPMFQIGWGGRILTLSVAVIIDMPEPAQLVIIGRLTLALPDPAVPLIRLQATVVGVFELAPNPGFSILASLSGSYIVGLPLHGDLLFLVRSGDDAVFVLSIGGFHPRYRRPIGVPQLTRVSIDLTPPGFPGLRAETYIAVTSNSVQFGASVELCATIAGCGLHGWLAFDVLFQWDPVFFFSVRCAAGIAIEVFGATLLGISFDLTVEGPTPWHIHGEGSLTLFFFSVSLDFDVSWGDPPPALPPAPDLAPIIAAALGARAAWVGAPPADSRSMVTISSQARKLLSGGDVIDPLGGLVVRQRTVPFDIDVSRFQNAPVPPQRWTIVGAELAPGVPADLANATTDEFAPGAFLALSEDEKLTRPAFERFNSGVNLTTGEVVAGELREVNTDFQVELIPDITLGIPNDLLIVAIAAEALLGIGDPHARMSLWASKTLEPVVVRPHQPLAVARTSTMLEEGRLSGAATTYTGLKQAVEAEFGSEGPQSTVQIIERWEAA